MKPMYLLGALGALAVVSLSAKAAEWTFLYEHSSGVKWYGTNAEKQPGGILRVYIKPVHPKRDPEPIAILLDCKKKQIRKYVPGDFGKEFFQPWQPIAPDSVGEIAFDSYCKK